jgi:hypothetical protein
MSNHDKDDLAGVDALPVYDRVTSRFIWVNKPTAPIETRFKTYGFEVEGGMGFIANGIRVGNPKK